MAFESIFCQIARWMILFPRGVVTVKEIVSGPVCDLALNLGADMAGIAESRPLEKEADDLENCSDSAIRAR